NAGRFFLVKAADQEQCGYARSKRTCASAVAALAIALSLYGTGNINLHHRAAANYWISMAMEKVFGPAAALSAVEQSLELWDRQLALDPENPHYQKGRQGAADRLRDLKDAVSAL
ncbi:MAG: hypothetical protein HYS15_01665, partial [Candidatus Spechtbacteria bacterium]|nr:hypothetical protein [Candidatus Spechtbacteria bacterium]